MRGRGQKRQQGRGGGRRDAKRPRTENGEWKFENTRSYRNEKFEAFYKAQGIVPEAEWDAFLAVLQVQLPVTFRVNPLAPDADTARRALTTEAWSKPFVLDDGRIVDAPKPLGWLEDAWQLGYGKPDLRKNKSLKAFHEWMQVMTSDGTVSRQEAVSMIPPLLLGVEPHHMVLDMCAAPGSKTAQLLESLHAGEMRQLSGRDSHSHGGELVGAGGAASSPPPLPFALGGTAATGMVVANDSDSKRAYLLTHQCARIGSPNLVVTCHDAQLFPNLNKGQSKAAIDKVKEEDRAGENRGVSDAAGSDGKPAQRLPGCFDRVLADVPCSGDGTARKNAEALIRWVPTNGLALHPLQVQITMRGLALLKVGGCLVYSTCSLNPAEDEAVVAEVLRRCDGSVKLVETSDKIPGLKRLPGVSTWKVYDKDMTAWDSFEHANAPNEHGHIPALGRKLLRSHFPPSPEVAASYHLDRCMRVTPHLQDTGGFFICLLRKTAPLPSAKPWFDVTATKSAAGADVIMAAPGADSSVVPSTNGPDSEDEVDFACARPLGLYAPAGPGKAANKLRHPRDAPAGSAIAASQALTETDAQLAAVAQDGGPARDGDEVAQAIAGGDEEEVDEDEEGEEEEEEEGVEAADLDVQDGSTAPGAAFIPEPVGKHTFSAKKNDGGGKTMAMPGGKQIFVAKRPPLEKGALDAGFAPNGRDGKGRVLSGRFEMTTYTHVDAASVTDVVASYGLLPTFPQHNLYTRSDSGNGGVMVLMTPAVVDMVLPQQKTITGEGRVKVVNSGIKLLAENKEKNRDAMARQGGMFGEETVGSGTSASSSAVCEFRLLQEGLLVLLPYMTRRVVHASGREISTVLRYRGGFAPATVYPPRLARALESIPPGSFCLVLNPALDGREEDTGAAGGAARAGPAFEDAVDLTADGANLPRASVPLSSATSIVPALRTHYTLSPDGSSLLFSPGVRIWPGTNPLARAAMCMWKGKQRFNVMLSANEAAGLLATLAAAGYSATSELTPQQQVDVEAMPAKPLPALKAHHPV